MGRKNNKARERAVAPENTEAMIHRLERENKVFKAHKTKHEFTDSFTIGALVDADTRKRLVKVGK